LRKDRGGGIFRPDQRLVRPAGFAGFGAEFGAGLPFFCLFETS
jgi:hypothetical protein